MAGEFSISGLTGSGFDGGAIVQQIMQLKSIPLQKLQAQKQEIGVKLASLGQLSDKVNSFYEFFSGLDTDELFKGKKATVSDTKILSATVDENAPNMEFSVTVDRLAQTEIRVSNGGVANLTDTFSSSGTLTISYNTGSTTETFNIDYSAGETIEDLVNSINSAQDKVKASVYYDGTKYSIMLSEKDVSASTVETDTVGGTYAIEVSGLPTELGTGLDTLQEAKNAQITIGSGSPVVSPTNTFENVISGLTLEVKDTGTSTVKIEDNYSKVSSFLKSFAGKYNDLVNVVDALTAGEDALFLGENTITNLKFGMANRLDPLIELGILDYDGDTGQISIDTSKLNSLLDTDPDKVKEAIDRLKSEFEPFMEAQKDTFKGFKDLLQDRIDRIDESIKAMAQRLAQEEVFLKMQYAQLESFIADSESLKQRFQQFMVSISSLGGNKK